MPSAGLDEASLRRALHDLRGPLNTLAVQLEILRVREVSTASGRELLTKAADSVRGLGHMLERIGRVSASLPVQTSVVPLQPQLRAAAMRARERTKCDVSTPDDEPADAAIRGTEGSVAAMLDSLVDCAAGALPQGGRIELTASAVSDCCEVRAHCDGPGVTLPSTFSCTKLDVSRPVAGDWFRLSCQLAGLAGEFVGDGADAAETIVIRFPLER